MRKCVHLVGYFLPFYTINFSRRTLPPLRLWTGSTLSLMAHTAAITVWCAITRLRYLDIFTNWSTTGYLWMCSHRLFSAMWPFGSHVVGLLFLKPNVTQGLKWDIWSPFQPATWCYRTPSAHLLSTATGYSPWIWYQFFLTISWIPDSTN